MNEDELDGESLSQMQDGFGEPHTEELKILKDLKCGLSPDIEYGALEDAAREWHDLFEHPDYDKIAEIFGDDFHNSHCLGAMLFIDKFFGKVKR